MRLFVLSVVTVFAMLSSLSAQNQSYANEKPVTIVGTIIKDVYKSTESEDNYILVVENDVRKENCSCRLLLFTVGDSAIFPINKSREYFLSRLVRGEKVSVHGKFDNAKEFLIVDGLIVDGERFNWPYNSKY